MKIFATSDIHGNKTILEKIKDLSYEETPDYILICGDIGGKHFTTKSLIDFSYKQMHDYDDFKSITGKFYFKSKLLFILGNDDWFDVIGGNYEYLPFIQHEIFRPFELVVITPFITNREANENKLEYELSKFSNIHNETIIVAHDVPYKCLNRCIDGREVGSKSIRKFIEKNQPKIWLGGHIHESFGVKNIGNTYVFNCSCRHEVDELRGWMIDTDTMNYEKIIR